MTGVKLDKDVLTGSSVPRTQTAATGDGIISTLEMNVACGVVDPVTEENEAYGALTDGIQNSNMRPNIAYHTGAVTTHEDPGGYAIIQDSSMAR